jgi:hypothetical protein
MVQRVDQPDAVAVAVALALLLAALGCNGGSPGRGDGGVGGIAGGGGATSTAGSDGGAGAVVLLPLSSRETVADPRQPVVYLAATATSPTHSSSVVAVSTMTGEIAWATPLPFEPADIDVSDDGATLYVTDAGPGMQVARLNLSTHAIELMFVLPTSADTGRPFSPIDITVIPGSPHTAVVSMFDGTWALAVFDDANMRPNWQLNSPNANVIRMLGPSSLYTLAAGTSSGSMYNFAVNAQGIGLGTGPVLGVGSYAQTFFFDGELIFSDDGIVVDPAKGTQVGVYEGSISAVAVDRAGGRTYLALPTQSSSAEPIVLVECDRLAFTRLRALTLPYTGFSFRMVRAIDGTLALDAHVERNQLVLIRPSAWSDAAPL